jgi:hypothetical protein
METLTRPATASPGESSFPTYNASGAIKAKDEPRYVGTFPRVIRWKIKVPTPLATSALPGSRPVSAGTKTVAPNIANKCCNDSGIALKKFFIPFPPFNCPTYDIFLLFNFRISIQLKIFFVFFYSIFVFSVDLIFTRRKQISVPGAYQGENPYQNDKSRNYVPCKFFVIRKVITP